MLDTVQDFLFLFTEDINAIYVLALQRSLIFLLGLTMRCFSEKMMISYSCILGFEISCPTRVKNLEWYLTHSTILHASCNSS